jgi:hypothetical protein
VNRNLVRVRVHGIFLAAVNLQVAFPLLFEIYGVNSKSHTNPMQKVTPPIFGL